MKVNRMRKTLGLVMLLVMLLSVLPVVGLAECDHSGGVASCQEQASCEKCGEAYGPLAPCSGGQASCQELANCSMCGQPYGEKLPCSGGQASCQELANCSMCGKPYGSTIPCTGGVASCTEQASCTMCGKPHGELAPHSFDGGYTCSSCGKGIAAALSVAKVTYNGTEQKPSVSVTFGGSALPSGAYAVSYSNNKNAGTATVTISATTAKYAFATVTKTFTIEPATLTVGPASYSITQNDSFPGLWLSYSGLVAGDSVTVSPAPNLSVYVASGASMSDSIKPMGKHTIYWNNMAAATISNPNYKLEKFETGVLNVIPTRAEFTVSGIKLVAVVDGYSVALHKLSDMNLSRILSHPEKDGTIKLDFKAESCLNYIHTVRLHLDMVEAIAKAANDPKNDVKALELTLPNGRSLKLDAKALDYIAEKAEGTQVAFSMVKSTDVKTSDIKPLKKAQKKDLGERPAYAYGVFSGKAEIEDIPGQLVMQIPYKLRYKETAADMKTYIVAEDGKRTAVKTSYDEDIKKVVWEANGMGLYVIEHEAAKK